jgi:hypothetical protein
MELKSLLLDMLLDTKTYEEQQNDSRAIDEYLGFNVYGVEDALVMNAMEKFPEGNCRSWGKSLYGGSEAWIGLNPKQLQTTYFEFLQIFETLDPRDGEQLCDLGAAYGRAGIIAGCFYPQVEFIGFEIVKERVDKGNEVFKKLDFKNSRMECEDLSGELSLPNSEYFFIYDYGIVSQIHKTLVQLSDMSMNKKLKVIARGRGVRSLIENKHKWLTSSEPVYLDNYTIYSSY